MGEQYGFSLDTPYEDIPEEARYAFIHGTGGKVLKVRYKGQRSEGTYDVPFEGLIKNMEQRYRETSSEYTKAEYEKYMTVSPCDSCKGMRLKPSSLAVTVGDRNIYEVTSLAIRELLDFMDNLSLTEHQMLIGKRIVREIRSRVQFLIDVGLDYLTLSRATSSLSGGEAQRIRLATQIGSGLVGVAYILDEPSIGLHQRDNGNSGGA